MNKKIGLPSYFYYLIYFKNYLVNNNIEKSFFNIKYFCQLLTIYYKKYLKKSITSFIFIKSRSLIKSSIISKIFLEKKSNLKFNSFIIYI